jgi:hypothetical protein
LNALTVNIKMTDIEVFEELLDLLRDITEDKRIDGHIRLEISKKILAIGEKAGIRTVR